MKQYVAIKCTMLTVTLSLGFAVLHYTHGQKSAKKPFIKPPAVKLMPDQASMQRLHQLALKAQDLVDTTLLKGSSDIKSMMMNHAMTIFFPYELSQAMDPQQMVQLVRQTLAEVGSKPITVEIDAIEWFGGPKKNTLVVKVKENTERMPHTFNTSLESKTKEAGMLPKTYAPKFAYNPHTSLVGITGAGEQRLVLEDDNLKVWEDVSSRNAKEKQNIITELNDIVSKTPLTFNKVVIYGSDFQPVETITLQ